MKYTAVITDKILTIAVKCKKCGMETKLPDCYGNCHKCTPFF